MELGQATGLVRGKENRWPYLAQVGGANDSIIKHPASWPRFLPGSDVDGTVLKPFWVKGADGHYANLAAKLLPDVTEPARGIAVADVFGDGYPDMVFANFWMDSVLIVNKGAGNGNGFLGLHLLLPVDDSPESTLPAANRVHDGHPSWREGTPATGAFVEIETADGGHQIRQVDGGNGHSGQRSPELRFGLGHNTGAIRTRITWRDLHGSLHRDELALSAGYHTVLLAAKGASR
jgi:hypothetical protein